MKIFHKVLLAGSVIAVLPLTQCDLVTTEVSKLFFPPKVIDFPLGRGKIVRYPITSWVKKPYGITFNTEYMNSDKSKNKIISKIPYHFSIKCYQLHSQGKEVLFFQDTYVIRNKAYNFGNETIIVQENIFDGGDGWVVPNPKSSESLGWSFPLTGFELSRGRYRCDFIDKSTPSINDYLKEAGIVRTVIKISPVKKFIY